MKKMITAVIVFISLNAGAQSRNGRYKSIYQKQARQQAKRDYAAQSGIVFGNTIIAKDNNYYSSNKQYYFRFQDDGNLVIYRSSDNRDLWASGTQNRGASCEFQGDANLVIKDVNGNVVFDAFANQANKRLAVSESSAFNTTRRGRNALVMQNDGNLVIYSGRGRTVKWASDTFAR